jgi:hypothetical protein
VWQELFSGSLNADQLTNFTSSRNDSKNINWRKAYNGCKTGVTYS